MPRKKQDAIQLHEFSAFPDASPMSSDIEIAGTYMEAGVRPVAASNLEIYSSYLNGRPVSASHLQIYEMLPGDRPVFMSEIRMVEGMLLPGDRPIMQSDPRLLEGSFLPGNRPIASNEIDDSTTLMGYID
ncbi:hypothetical protein K9N68_28480 [Kovacikia minuta CCNUW1]|uniref:hypothetical protein n=1 Tax=Kovacikia minuta TaxID=2931930 RepID=UPI001CCDF7B4|nr:hypothetical protein [Kovacikia minuta]UBF25478.1 hypothetical protein K9N68_28480 [Kovacikia minuta CCNUW1]